MKRSGRIPELDGLRGLAILMVLVFHVAGATSPQGHRWAYYLKDVLALGWSGVDLFFVLSGFLIGGILIDARDSPNYFQTFYARRAFRILPIYAVFLYASFLLAGQLGRSVVPWYAYATFTQNIRYALGASAAPVSLAITWSLAIEEQFYLALPAIVRFVSKDNLWYVVSAGIGIAPALRTILVRSHAYMAAFTLMPCRADALLLGVLVAMLMRDESKWKWVIRNRMRIAWMCVSLIAGLGVFVVKNQISEIASAWMSTIGYSWFAVLYAALLVLALTWNDGWYGAALRVRLLTWFGTISYALYLIHWAVVTMIFRSRPWVDTRAAVFLMVLGVGTSLSVAALSWSVFEKPLLKIGHRFRY